MTTLKVLDIGQPNLQYVIDRKQIKWSLQLSQFIFFRNFLDFSTQIRTQGDVPSLLWVEEAVWGRQCSYNGKDRIPNMRDPNGERMPEVSKRVGENSGLGKNHSRALKKIVSEAHTGPGIIPVPSGQSGKSHNSGGIS